MDRLACVSVRSFGLQVVLREHPDWSDHPVAVVSDNAALGKILELNKKARGAGLREGDTYASALSLCPGLRAEVVCAQKLAAHLGDVCDVLEKYSPGVEPSSLEPGVAWLDCSGLGRVFASPAELSRKIVASLKELGFYAAICIGFTRFGTYALVREGKQRRVTSSAAREQQAARVVPLAHLGIDPIGLEKLHKLGVYTVGDLLRLPAEGLRSRFKERVYQVHKLAVGDVWEPLQPRVVRKNPVVTAELESPDDNAHRLLFVMKKMMGQLLEEMAAAKEALRQFDIVLQLDHHPPLETFIAPAEPTLDMKQLLELLRLKLESLQLPEKVVEIRMEGQVVKATPGQLALFAASAGRDLDAANGALAKIRAGFGECVFVAKVEEGHLPEASYSFRSLKRLERSHPEKGERVLLRRVHKKAIPLNSKPVRGPAGVHLGGLGGAPVKEMTGPYCVSGGWWQKEVYRDYYFAATDAGEVLWVYFDRRRRRWFLQGGVE